MRKTGAILIFLAFTLFACAGEAAEVTRIVEVPVTRIVEQTVTQDVEVTTEIEVTRIVEVEVTRLVEVPVTVTPAPSPTPEPTEEGFDTSRVFAFNFGGSVESNGVTVEFARALFMERDALIDEGLDFTGFSMFTNAEYVTEVIWRITNNTDVPIRWAYDDLAARVNTRQIELRDWIINSGTNKFGTMPTEAIFPGSTIVGGVWFSHGIIVPDDITGAALLFGPARNDDSFAPITGFFSVEVDLSGPHTWEPLPDELRS